ncbi:MAG: UDP-N-acetylmuramoyl-L-alanine--D-glutamate ligase [Candidatus Liptonbacteria bacterium]|nr:UDP-N-acetylmuramoyl-L-alanine--D-glutamate ligase [Candidatus Liptonbacteria bacterium]
MKIAILGFGREGRSILKFLKKDKEFKKAEVCIVDKKSTIKLPRGCRARLGKNYLKNLDDFDIIFRSPGIPYLLPEIQKAKKQGVKISSATNLFFERYPGKIVGIIGTKGKGTTATLLYKILRVAGKDVFLAGNIGTPSLDILSKTDKKSIVIFELSSFQLQDLKISPSIAAVLDVFPDHLDAHKNLKEYYDAKSNIGRYQKPGDKIFFFKNNNLSRHVASKGDGKKISVDEESYKLFSPEDLLIKGAHNFKNAVMAATIAKSIDVPQKIILKTVKKFRGLPYRIQFTKKIRGVSYYNDSASTNPLSTIAAIKSFSQPIILISGGVSKNIDFKEFGKIADKTLKMIILFGENKKEIRKTIKDSSKVKMAGILKNAIKIASSFSSSGDIILFSPASTSFDMFKNYEERGLAFDKIVEFMR